ncbi:hypothetical protein BpHYR1_046690 [Brachionus plicatilis]|uniref:Uncharacterized protein n=1 Tax=Brachionus plicatilis TaxID=10195 RepID=A0A3M7RW78_BRAPC|nr:hypothetical protein BpHYR1_046690 [Brachionus plicatilis]
MKTYESKFISLLIRLFCSFKKAIYTTYPLDSWIKKNSNFSRLPTTCSVTRVNKGHCMQTKVFLRDKKEENKKKIFTKLNYFPLEFARNYAN